MTHPLIRAIGSALLVFAFQSGCAPGASQPSPTVNLTESLVGAEAEWLEGWEQPGPLFKPTGDASFEQFRGSQLSLRLVLPEDAMLRGSGRLFQSHDRRASHFPILGEVSVSLFLDAGEVLPILELPFNVPGDAVGFAINHDLADLAGEGAWLVLRLDAGEPELTRRAIHRRLRLTWSDLRVEGTGARREADSNR
jgi:hypothetical protein